MSASVASFGAAERFHYAVTVDADPGRDLGADDMPGHRFFFFFTANELERIL